jgi:hypothetical protein
MQEGSQYHNVAAHVHVGRHWCFEIGAIWDGVSYAEAAGISLDQIGRALPHNWSATVIALALRNMATLRTLIREASRG